MRNKNFAGGMDSLIEGTANGQPRRGRPVTQTKEIINSSEKGTREGEIRAGFILNKELLNKLKALAYWERVLIKDVVSEAIEAHIARYEKKNGPVKPIPGK